MEKAKKQRGICRAKRYENKSKEKKEKTGNSSTI